jgi:5-hydroxyisourate hydrolase
VPIDFSRKDGDAWKLLKTVTADENGRVDEQGPLMTADTMAVGGYELLFYVEEYYKRAGVKLTDPAFLDTVPVRIAIFDAKQSYHVPLLLPVGHPELPGQLSLKLERSRT